MTQTNQIAAQRMFLNAGKTAVLAEGHEDAAFFYAGKGDEIPATACERFGIVDGKVPTKGRAKASGKAQGEGKEKAPPANKGGKTPANKGGEKPDNKGGSGGEAKPAALTDIDGIGPATAKALVAAGVADVAALAAVDPASPPQLEKTPPNFDWAAVVAAAKAQTGDAE